MGERFVIGGKLTDLTDPKQLGRLNDLLSQMLSVLNKFDPASFALSWIEGAAAGQVIASKGVGNTPEWDASPTLAGATFTGPITTKGVDTTDDLVVDIATKGLVLKDTQGTPHYWRVTVNNTGTLVISDAGTTKP